MLLSVCVCEPGMVVCAYGPNTWEMEVGGGGTGIQDHPQVWSMSEASLGDRTLPQKPKTYERKKMCIHEQELFQRDWMWRAS